MNAFAERRPARAGVVPPQVVDVVVLVVVWIVMVVVANPIGDFPINDDWVYGEAVRKLVTTGRFEVSPFSSAHVGPQVYWGALFAQIFGLSFTSLRLSTLVLGLAGGIGVYFLFREVWKDRIGALVLALAVLVNPIYFALSNTFMTDVPYFALTTVTMTLIVAGLSRDNGRLLAAGLVLAIFAVLLRQFAVTILAGYALAHVVRRGLSIRSIVVAVVPLCSAVVLSSLFSKWLELSGRRPTLHGIASLSQVLEGIELWRMNGVVLTALAYVGMFLIPLAVLYLPRFLARHPSRNERAIRIAIVLTTVALGYAFVVRKLVMPIGENVLYWYGIGPLLNGDSFKLGANLPMQTLTNFLAWEGVTALSVLSAACLLVASGVGGVGLLRAIRERRASLTAPSYLFIGTTAVYVLILMMLANQFTVQDRYMLPLLVLAALALPQLRAVRSAPTTLAGFRRVVIAIVLVTSAVFSVVGTHDYLRWSGVRWNALQELVASGVSPNMIDGGYEFNGTYLYDPSYRIVKTKSWWWVDRDDYLAASGPVPGYTEYRRYPVDRWWRNGLSDVVILKR